MNGLNNPFLFFHLSLDFGGGKIIIRAIKCSNNFLIGTNPFQIVCCQYSAIKIYFKYLL